MAKRAEYKRKKILEESFVVWFETLSNEEIKEIEKQLPLSLMVSYNTNNFGNADVRNWLFNYYLKIK
jgi:hypothetical protein